MQYKVGESYYGFRLIEERKIPEVNGVGYQFIHEKSKITLLAINNDDPHKVFSINVKTIPHNNKGTAHIVEHAVCCASKHYPLKETFVALGQGSICTTMNACTYPDRTMYYAASPNEKDLLGVLGVYIDLVFHPAIEMDNRYFLQEGWHYDLDEEEDLQISGVVYHEMLGEYGEASAYLQHYELNSIFPDTCYGYDAGGLPEEIMTLTEEEFLAFYHEFYVGSNTILTLYGDYHLETFLEVLDKQYLMQIPQGEINSQIEEQEPFTKPHYTVAYYPTQLANSPILASLCFRVGGCQNPEERLAFEILEHILLRSTASPLLSEIVMKKHLGMSLSDGGYDSCRTEPVFSITLKGTNKDNAIKFEETTLEVLKQLVREGIDPKLIDAAIATLEFELKETDNSYEPIGILYSEMMVTNAYVAGDVFAHLNYKEALARIKANCHQGYFEKMIETYFINNSHRALTIVVPNKEMQENKQIQLASYLAEKKLQMTEEEIMQLIALNEQLEEDQLKENSEEELSILPQLSLEDLPKGVEMLTLKEMKLNDCQVQLHEADTKDIAYFHFLWQADHMPYDKWHTLGLLAHIFTYIGTKDKSFSEVENAINTYTGSMSVAVHAYHQEELGITMPIFKVSCKVLKDYLSEFENLMVELFTKTCFEEKDKLKELVGHIVYELERSLTGAPEYRAVQRVYAYLSPEGRYEDEVSGFGFYHYIKAIYSDFDQAYPQLREALQSTFNQLMNKKQLKMSVTVSKQDEVAVNKMLCNLLKQLPSDEKIEHISVDEWAKKHAIKGNEGFINGQEGQAIAKAISYKDKGVSYKGQLEVVCNVLENTYLWDRVRLQGGAYGCDIMLTREGYLSVCSYCDPNLSETLTIFDQIGDYLEKLKLSPRIIERAIISTLGAMLVPTSMEQKSERACTYFITGTRQSLRQQIYHEIRQTTLKDFHEAATIFKHIGTEGVVCIMGNREKLIEKKSQLSLIDLEI